ncbi:MAG: hypothetical protein KC620_22260, partial [Myxococcales bacterium]|nr:hypothetical protein [Myxococcales bacterium]
SGAKLALASVAIAHLAAAPWAAWRLQRGVPADSAAEGVLLAVEAITFIMVVVAVVLTLRVLAQPDPPQEKARKMR